MAHKYLKLLQYFNRVWRLESVFMVKVTVGSGLEVGNFPRVRDDMGTSIGGLEVWN
jgi:hypothetical protein